MTAKLSYVSVKQSFEKEGYELLSKQYINAQMNLKALCNQGHRVNTPWSNWSRGVRCSKCAGNRRLTLEFVKAEFSKEGYMLLSKAYKNNSIKLKYKCPIGHINFMAYSNWTQGKRCPICQQIKRTGGFHYNWKGGISCEQYCDAWGDKDYKEGIKERDNYKCQNPNCWNTNKRLMIHHIDYDKQNCAPSNLVVICNSCNSRANYEREYWQKVYIIVMKEKELC